MTGTKPMRMTRQQYTRLRNTLDALRSELIIEVPDDMMDLDANRSALQRRIRKLQNMLAQAVIAENFASDSIAEPGTVLTIRYNGTGETETFLLGRRGSEGADIKVYSMASPLGRAIAGARPGDTRIYSTPGETGRLVTLLEAVPYEMHLAKHPRPQTVHRDPSVQRIESVPKTHRAPTRFTLREDRDLNLPSHKESNEHDQHATRVDFAARL